MASMVKRNGKWLSKPYKDPITGKRVTKQFDTRELALAYEEACDSAVRAGLSALPQAATITEGRSLRALTKRTLLTRYATSSDNTKHTMRHIYNVLERSFGADTVVTEVLRKDTLTVWVASMDDKAPATRNLYRAALSTLVAEAAEAGLCPAFKLKNEKVANAKDKYLTDDEEDRLMIHLRDDVRTLSRFMLLTGLRISEAVSVRPDHVQGNVLGNVGKGTKVRRVPLTEEARGLLEESGGWGHLSPTVVQNHLRRATHKAGIEGVTPHTLRHTTASRLAQAGLGMLQLQQFMGHANLTTTQRYSHLAPGWGDSVISLLDNC